VGKGSFFHGLIDPEVRNTKMKYKNPKLEIKVRENSGVSVSKELIIRINNAIIALKTNARA
jgi:hypothetical protein